MKKSIIGITTGILVDKNPDPGVLSVDRIYLNREYVSAVEKVGGMPLMLPVSTDEDIVSTYADMCDGFIFSGGNDINPLFYNEGPHPNLGVVNSDVDLYQITLMKKILERGKPMLLICRGMQLINIIKGGTIYQDLSDIGGKVFKHEQFAPKYEPIHRVKLVEGTKLYEMFGPSLNVNSYHHQCVKDPGEGLRVAARTEDGVIEAMELENYGFCIGVQWHPEMLFMNAEAPKILFESLIESTRN